MREALLPAWRLDVLVLAGRGETRQHFKSPNKGEITKPRLKAWVGIIPQFYRQP